MGSTSDGVVLFNRSTHVINLPICRHAKTPCHTRVPAADGMTSREACCMCVCVCLPGMDTTTRDDLKMKEKESRRPRRRRRAMGLHEPQRERDDGSQVASPPKRAQCVNSAWTRSLNAKEHSGKRNAGQQRRDKRSCRSQMRSASRCRDASRC